MMIKWSLYPVAVPPYNAGHVAADDHKHYLPGGVIFHTCREKVSACAHRPFEFSPYDCREDAANVRRDNRL